jgi:hypothetical protein
MLLQLVLSFGHIHLDDLTSGDGVASIAASASPASHQDPPGHPGSEADDYCPICAAIHLASSSLLPDAPVLPAPFAFGKADHFTHLTSVSILLKRAPFQSRAPPLA